MGLCKILTIEKTNTSSPRREKIRTTQKTCFHSSSLLKRQSISNIYSPKQNQSKNYSLNNVHPQKLRLITGAPIE